MTLDEHVGEIIGSKAEHLPSCPPSCYESVTLLQNSTRRNSKSAKMYNGATISCLVAAGSFVGITLDTSYRPAFIGGTALSLAACYVFYRMAEHYKKTAQEMKNNSH